MFIGYFGATFFTCFADKGWCLAQPFSLASLTKVVVKYRQHHPPPQ